MWFLSFPFAIPYLCFFVCDDKEFLCQCSNIRLILKITSNSHYWRRLLQLLPNRKGGSCHLRSCCRLPVPEILKVSISKRMSGSRERIDSRNVDQVLLPNLSLSTVMTVKCMIQWGYAKEPTEIKVASQPVSVRSAPPIYPFIQH